jgi:ABC-type nitrate/sulfonate/bicarbonate transport system substrate-binding protein
VSHLSRIRSLALMAAAAATAALLAASAASARTDSEAGTSRPAARTLVVGVQQSYNMLPIFVALRHGYLKQAGIGNVKFTVFQSLPAMFAAIAQGQVDIGLQTIPSLWNYNKATGGTKLKYIAPGQTNAILWAAPMSSSIPVATKKDWKKTVLAWKGKKIGIPAFGGVVDLFTRYMLKEAGLSASDVTLNAIGAGPASVAALQSGVVDVTTGDGFTLALLQSQKLGKNVINLAFGQGPPEFINLLISGYFTSESSIQKERRLWVGFSAGLAKARVYMRNPKHRRDVIDILTRKVGVTANEAAILYKVAVPSAANVALNRRTFDKTVAAYATTGVLTAPAPTYSDLVADFAR